MRKKHESELRRDVIAERAVLERAAWSAPGIAPVEDRVRVGT